MKATQLMADLTRLGIRIEADGDRLRYSPRSAVTPDLADQMKSHKDALLAILQGDSKIPPIDLSSATAIWQAALDRLEGDPLFSPDIMESLRAADAQWADDSEAYEAIAPPCPCPECGTLELWQSLVGNWRCLRCDPPTKTQLLQERPTRLKLDDTKYAKINAKGDP